MTKTEYLEQICTNLGIDVSKFPDRLLSTFLSAISERLGIMKETGTLDEYLSAFTGGGNDNSGNDNNAGTGADSALAVEVEEMLTKFPFLRKVEWLTNTNSYDEHWEDPYSISGYGGVIVSSLDGRATMAIVPPWVTEVQSDSLGHIDTYVIFTSKTPPAISEQGTWAEWGGCCPPQAIFVPDESLEAYKNTPNLTEFAHLIKPLSEYNGEGYYGGKL